MILSGVSSVSANPVIPSTLTSFRLLVAAKSWSCDVWCIWTNTSFRDTIGNVWSRFSGTLRVRSSCIPAPVMKLYMCLCTCTCINKAFQLNNTSFVLRKWLVTNCQEKDTRHKAYSLKTLSMFPVYSLRDNINVKKMRLSLFGLLALITVGLTCGYLFETFTIPVISHDFLLVTYVKHRKSDIECFPYMLRINMQFVLSSQK